MNLLLTRGSCSRCQLLTAAGLGRPSSPRTLRLASRSRLRNSVGLTYQIRRKEKGRKEHSRATSLREKACLLYLLSSCLTRSGAFINKESSCEGAQLGPGATTVLPASPCSDFQEGSAQALRPPNVLTVEIVSLECMLSRIGRRPRVLGEPGTRASISGHGGGRTVPRKAYQEC